MATLTINIEEVKLTSYWTITPAGGTSSSGAFIWKASFSTPSSPWTTRTVDLSSIVENSRVISAILNVNKPAASCSENISYNNIKKYLVNGDNALDVTDWFSGMTSFSSMDIKFAMQGHGSTSYSSVTVKFTNMTLVIEYELPNSSGILSTVSTSIGQTINLTVVPSNPAYSHKAIWTVGNATTTSNLSVGSTQASFELTGDYASQIPDSTSGTGSVKLITYDGNTEVGYVVYNFTINIPNTTTYTPSIGSVSINPGSSNQTIAALNNKYIQGYSYAIVNLNNVSPGAGSRISNVTITCSNSDGWSYTSSTNSSTYSATTNVYNQSGTKNFTITVTDARGRTASTTASISVTAYSRPSITKITARRCSDSTGQTFSETGTYIRAVVTYTVSSAGGINSVNSSTLKYRTGNGGYTNSGVSFHNNSGVGVIGGADGSSNELSADLSWEVQAVVTDTFGNQATSTAVVPTAEYVLHFKDGGKAIGIGTAAGNNNTLTVNSNWKVNIGGIDVKDTIDGLSSAINGVSSSLSSLPISQTTGQIPMSRGGTGATTAYEAASTLNFTQAIPYVNSSGITVNTITLPQYSGFMGVITSSRKEFRCMIPIGRRINANSVSISGTGYLITNDGKIRGGDGAVAISSMGAINTVISNDGFVGLCITTTDTFGGSNNIPAVLSVENFTLTFS